MINFIIVEDNKIQLKQMEEMINNYMMKNNLEYKIHKFNDYQEKLEELINNSKNNIYILDYELPSTNAIEIAREVRENDWTSPIIVNSSYGELEYGTLKQRLQILDFIPKYKQNKKLIHELLDICLEQCNIKKSFKFKTSGIVYNIEYQNIIYIYRDSFDRKAVLITKDNSYKIRSSIVEIRRQLDDTFVTTCKGCLVNINKVEVFDWTEKKIILKDKVELHMLSRTHKKEIESILIKKKKEVLFV